MYMWSARARALHRGAYCVCVCVWGGSAQAKHSGLNPPHARTNRARHLRYAADFRKGPADTAPFSKTAGGYWISQRPLPPSAPFVASTTYRAETLAGPQTAAQQLDRSEGLACTLVGYEAARQANDVRRSQSASPHVRAEHTARGIGLQTAAAAAAAATTTTTSSSTAQTSPRFGGATDSFASASQQRPSTVPTAHGELPGFQTTYGSMTDQSCRRLADSMEQRPASSGSPPGDPRWRTMPRVMAPTMQRACTSYAREYGPDGSDPMARQAPGKATMTRLSATRDLAEGTTRNTCNVPRYTGHMPASQYASEAGRVQGEAAAPRPDHKADALLFTLDQYSRSRVPGYTGFKPQDARNVSVTQPAQGPTSATTSGDATQRAARFGLPHHDHEHYINSRLGLMTFFNNSNAGTSFVSENGLHNAQGYYKECKALGMLNIRTGRPPKTTAYGATFRAAASLV